MIKYIVFEFVRREHQLAYIFIKFLLKDCFCEIIRKLCVCVLLEINGIYFNDKMYKNLLYCKIRY